VSRTPLVDSLRRAFRLALLSARADARTPPLDELVEQAYGRRRFLRDSALASAAALSACRPAQPPASNTTGAPAATAPGGPPRIAIVGAGMAGLNAAYKLQQAGLTATIFEGANRTGGRMFTARDLLADGLTTELGGEFIDSSHKELLALMQEFGLERLDTLGPGSEKLKPETYFVNGRHYTQAQAARAFLPLAKKIAADYEEIEDVVNYEHEGGAGELDRISMAEYFDRIGASGWMRELLEVAYVTEYGLDVGEQSALNFLFLIGTGDLEDEKNLELLGESDERYKVRGGNQQVVDELARRVQPWIRPLHRLEAIKSNGQGFTLTFQTGGTPVDERADIVLLTIPFSILRELTLQVDLTPLKKKAIQELGYGANAKVMVGFRSRPWEAQGYSGSTYSDETFQLAWANSYLQPGTAGGLTLYSGGKLAHDAGQGSAEEAAVRLMRGIERAYKGAMAQRNGKVSRFHWPTFPWTKGSYSCYKPGQWTTIAGSEGLPVGNLFFAGEHCSYDFQGYMNGAAQSGADTARAIMGKVSAAVPKAARARQSAGAYPRRAVLAAHLRA
jgi:monoamine oxidase